MQLWNIHNYVHLQVGLVSFMFSDVLFLICLALTQEDILAGFFFQQLACIHLVQLMRLFSEFSPFTFLKFLASYSVIMYSTSAVSSSFELSWDTFVLQFSRNVYYINILYHGIIYIIILSIAQYGVSLHRIYSVIISFFTGLCLFNCDSILPVVVFLFYLIWLYI